MGKFKLKRNGIVFEGRKLFQIQAIRDFITTDGILVSKGDIGGWVEREENLSQEGTSWIFNNGKVYDHAWVGDQAIIKDNAKVYGSAAVFGKSIVSGNVQVYGNAEIYDYAKVSGCTTVYGNAIIRKEANIKNISEWLCITGIEPTAMTFFYSNGVLYIASSDFCITYSSFVEENPESLYTKMKNIIEQTLK